MKLNLGRESEARFGQYLKFSQDAECLIVILKLMLGRDSEDEFSRFVLQLVI